MEGVAYRWRSEKLWDGGITCIKSGLLVHLSSHAAIEKPIKYFPSFFAARAAEQTMANGFGLTIGFSL